MKISKFSKTITLCADALINVQLSKVVEFIHITRMERYHFLLPIILKSIYLYTLGVVDLFTLGVVHSKGSQVIPFPHDTTFTLIRHSHYICTKTNFKNESQLCGIWVISLFCLFFNCLINAG